MFGSIAYIRKTFIKQLNAYDCGLACVRSLLGYAGLYNDIALIQSGYSWPVDGISLLNIRDAAKIFGVTGVCVSTDLEGLKGLEHPCILHVNDRNGKGHFVVLYGYKKNGNICRFLIGDPASTVGYIPADYLKEIWQSKTAVIFLQLPEHLKSSCVKRKIYIQLLKLFPQQLFLVIPLLSVLVTLFGISTSFVFQKIFDLVLNGNSQALYFVAGLLFFVLLTKCAFSYLKQYIMILLNSILNKSLMSRLILSMNRSLGEVKYLPGGKVVSSSLKDIYKIQTGLSSFTSVILSDGVLIFSIVLFTFYMEAA